MDINVIEEHAASILRDEYKVKCNTEEIRMRMWQDYTHGQENLQAQIHEVIGGLKQGFTVKQLYVGYVVLQCHRRSK